MVESDLPTVPVADNDQERKVDDMLSDLGMKRIEEGVRVDLSQVTFANVDIDKMRALLSFAIKEGIIRPESK